MTQFLKTFDLIYRNLEQEDNTFIFCVINIIS